MAEPWVLARTNGQLVAIRALDVLEIASDPAPRTIPGASARVRGLMRLRDSTIPLLDLRACLGMPSARERLAELAAVFAAREEDHKRWMGALERAVTDGEPFTLSLDPHKCAFGRWYDAYRPESLMLAAQLRRIGAPHTRLHEGGARALELLARGLRTEAQAAVDALRATAFRETVLHFEDAKRLIADEAREVALVVQAGGGRVALAVDSAEGVEPLTPIDAEGRPSPLLLGFAHRIREEGTVLLIDLQQVLAGFGPIGVA